MASEFKIQLTVKLPNSDDLDRPYFRRIVKAVSDQIIDLSEDCNFDLGVAAAIYGSVARALAEGESLPDKSSLEGEIAESVVEGFLGAVFHEASSREPVSRSEDAVEKQRSPYLQSWELYGDIKKLDGATRIDAAITKMSLLRERGISAEQVERVFSYCSEAIKERLRFVESLAGARKILLIEDRAGWAETASDEDILHLKYAMALRDALHLGPFFDTVAGALEDFAERAEKGEIEKVARAMENLPSSVVSAYNVSPSSYIERIEDEEAAWAATRAWVAEGIYRSELVARLDRDFELHYWSTHTFISEMEQRLSAWGMMRKKKNGLVFYCRDRYT